jgi:uncharacterized protein YndB with AHSA1/START domain
MSRIRLGLGIGGLVLLGLGVWAGLSFQRLRTAALQWEGPVAEILSERLDKHAATMTMEFTSRLDAPLADIWQAFSEPERSAEFSETIRVSRLLQAQGNRKLILFEMVMLGQPQRLSMQFTFLPAENRVRIQSVESQLSDIQGEYRFTSSPDGTKTLLTYTGTLKDKVSLPVPLALQKNAARESFVSTVRALKKGVESRNPTGS